MISSNVKGVIRAMRERPQAVERELAAAARTLGPELSGESKRIIQSDIYNVPIPLSDAAEQRFGAKAKIREKTSKGKHGKWQRTGLLKRSEGYRLQGPVVILTNSARHAGYRFRLGTSDGADIVSPGVKSVQWQTRAVLNRRARVLDVRRRAVLRGLAGTRVGG